MCFQEEWTGACQKLKSLTQFGRLLFQPLYIVADQLSFITLYGQRTVPTCMTYNECSTHCRQEA